MKSIAQICNELLREKTMEQLDQDLTKLVDGLVSCGVLYPDSVRAFKKRFITRTLRRNKNNRCKAARELGMHRNTMFRLIAELEIEMPPAKRGPGRKPVTSAVNPNTKGGAHSALSQIGR